MIAYLTSSPGGIIIRGENKYPTCSDPDKAKITDSYMNVFLDSFPMSGLSIQGIDVCDHRDTKVVQRIKDYDVVILAGGHVPTQNAFFQEIDLKKYIQTFDGILIGISAGSMNCAEIVYSHPELDGESEDLEYQRFIDGLGITNYMILPHYQYMKDEILDGKRVIEDITFPDSMGKRFYALVDGSYLLIENGITKLCGEGYLITDGKIAKICDEGSSIVLD